MKRLVVVAGVSLLAVLGCRMPGRPPEGPEVPRPDEVLSFSQLYGENCAGCHGAKGEHGPATDLANPEYQALIDDASLRDVIANGEKGSLMPGFGVRGGGDLTDAQIDALVRGLRSSWSKPNAVAGAALPPWHAQRAGDARKGQAVYAAACARCHGANAQQPGAAGSILDGSFLALVNEQTLRTTIIAGRPDIGQPDWRNLIAGRALSDEEISDVSAWLLSQRPSRPGHPYPDQQPTSERPGEQQPIAVKNH
jgi:cytochrome c oxidase cbb3-type subunit 3/ubiquinol-cytochrome c reductase cytochrome c subunit